MSKIIKKDMIYTPTNKIRTLHIYLPDGYENSNQRYPVMYFFDGHNLYHDEDATYGKSWGLKTFLDHWGKNMIIVGIECGHEKKERLSEYLPYSTKKTRFSRFKVLGKKTFQWIIDEVKVMIDQEYRTYPFRECCGIAGSSMGGIMALYGILAHNDVFSKAACISSAISFCMDKVEKDLNRKKISPDTRVYLSWGEYEEGEHTFQHHKTIFDSMMYRGCAIKVCRQQYGNHNEASWELLVPDFMDFLWMQ